MPYNERVLWEISNLLKSKLTDYLQPMVIDEAISNFKVLDEKKDKKGKKEIHRGKIRDGLIASCVYFACKSRAINKTPEEIAAIMDVDISTFNKCTKIYNRITDTKQEVVKSADFVDTYYNNLNIKSISYRVQCTTKKICEAVEELDILDGTIPQNITAGCIIFTSNEMGLGIEIKSAIKKFSISLNTLNKITSVITANKSKIYKNILEKKVNKLNNSN
jgi:transcription initiation factor TFIIIB Brf1 subunit/transcription initiation factor TFIIB